MTAARKSAKSWSPDKPLFAGATNGHIAARLVYVNGGEPVPLAMVGVVSEYMYACLTDAIAKFNKTQQWNVLAAIKDAAKSKAKP